MDIDDVVYPLASQAKPKQAATQRREGAGVGEASDYYPFTSLNFGRVFIV